MDSAKKFVRTCNSTKEMGVNRKFEKKIESLRKKKMAKQTFEENTHITS